MAHFPHSNPLVSTTTLNGFSGRVTHICLGPRLVTNTVVCRNAAISVLYLMHTHTYVHR